VFKRLDPQPVIASSNIAVDEGIELINSSISQLGLSALNNNNNFLASSIIIPENLASSNTPSDSLVFNTPVHNDLFPSLVKYKKKKKGRPAHKEPFK
jgi:hypothetical protein